MSDERPPRFPRSGPPREARGGIRAHSRRGGFGSTWWAARWTSVLERLELGGRLQRARHYARRGQVVRLEVLPGRVEAQVQGSRPQPYDVAIQVAVLAAEQWSAVGAALAHRAGFAARLLAGEMPAEVEDVFESAGVSLFPVRRSDLETACSCPDVSNPCKHIAAVYYLLAEELDRDPFLLFRLRGLDRDGLVRLLRLGGGAGEPVPAAPAGEPLPADATAFWRGTPIPEEAVGDAAPASVAAALLQRLGRFPFWRGREPLPLSLAPVYEAAAAAAVDVFMRAGRRS
jgi:uncharacterized Zn finger protein